MPPFELLMGPGWLEPFGLDRCSLRAGAAAEKPAEFMGHAQRLGAGGIRDKELAFNPQSFHVDDLETAFEPQVLSNSPTRDKSDP